MEIVFPMLDDRLSSKPLPEPGTGLPPIVESVTPIVNACEEGPVPDARRCLNVAVLLAASQIVQKLSATQPAPEVLLKLVESIRYLSAVFDRAATRESDAQDPVPPECLPAVVQDVYGVQWCSESTAVGNVEERV